MLNFENDRLYEKHSAMINDRFRRWYLKAFYYLGAAKINRIAAGVKSQYPPGEQRKYAFSKAIKRASLARYDHSPRRGLARIGKTERV